MSFKEREKEANEMRDQGHGDLAAAHQMEEFVDDEPVRTDAINDSDEIAEEMRRQSDEGDFSDQELADEMDRLRRGEDEADFSDPFGDDEAEGDDVAEDTDTDGPARLELTDENLDALVTVKVMGEEREVSLRDALDGHMRQSAFTQKSQDLANQRRELDAIRSRHEEAIETYLASDLLTPGQRQALQANYQAIQAERARDAEAANETYLTEQKALLHESMGWDKADAESVKAEQRELRAAAAHYGFSADEVSEVVDARVFPILRDAAKYIQMSEKGKEVRSKAKKAPVLKPGSTSGRKSSKSRELKEARKRFAATGNIHDGAKVMELEGFVD